MTLPNDSGYKSGRYASDEQTSEYIGRISRYLEQRNATWLDRRTDEAGEIQTDVCQLASLWRLDSHLAEWCVETGRLDRSSVPLTGIKAGQIGRLTAVCYFRSEGDRRALAFEAARFLDEAEWRLTEEETRCSSVTS